MWQVGTFILAGVCLGIIVGFLFDQPPLGVVIGLAVGAALDSWLRHQSEKENKR